MKAALRKWMKKKSKHTENMLFSCCFPMFMAHYIRFSINLSQVHVTVASQRLPSQIIHPFRNLFTTHFLYEAIPTAANVRTWIGDQGFWGGIRGKTNIISSLHGYVIYFPSHSAYFSFHSSFKSQRTVGTVA